MKIFGKILVQYPYVPTGRMTLRGTRQRKVRVLGFWTGLLPLCHYKWTTPAMVADVVALGGGGVGGVVIVAVVTTTLNVCNFFMFSVVAVVVVLLRLLSYFTSYCRSCYQSRLPLPASLAIAICWFWYAKYTFWYKIKLCLKVKQTTFLALKINTIKRKMLLYFV